MRSLALLICAFAAVAAHGGCAQSQDFGPPATGGSKATGGTTQAGGSTGSGGITGSGGVGSMGGSGGSMGGSGGSTGGSGGAAPPATFTQVYQMILSVECAGSGCHSPGSQAGVTFGSQSRAYSAVSARVIPGDAEGSALYVLLFGGQMPPPPADNLSDGQLAELASWIDAGALNN
jgi:hypothetical protein